MNTEASTFSGIDMQEANGKQPIPEDRNSDARNKGSPNADKNETGHGEMKLLKRKTEVCGTHTQKIQEKIDSTNNNVGFGQEESNVLLKIPQMDSNKNNSKNIEDLQSDSSKDNPNDEKETASKVVNDSIEEVSSGKGIVHSIKNTDITGDKSMSVSLKENSIYKGTVSSQVVSIESRENKETVLDSADQETFAAEENAIVKGYNATGEDLSVAKYFEDGVKLQVDENIAKCESTSMTQVAAGHENVSVDESIEANDNIESDESVAGLLTNEASPTKVCETFTAAKTNSFDEKYMIPKTCMASIPHSSNSELFTEVKPSAPMQSMKANQSIYKLAFNESLTSSENNSGSLSPLDPESQVPSSIPNDEIIVYEANTDSDAGSEDVEIIAHRYECETSLNKNKNVYVNKLSLAVELLRTQESLPYDSNFKRIVEDNDPSTEDVEGEVNFGFEEDSTFFNSSNQSRGVVVTSPSKSNMLPIKGGRQCTSGASSSIVDENGFNDSCDEALVATPVKERDATKEVKAANRRYKLQLRHYFTPSATNPCLCCVVM